MRSPIAATVAGISPAPACPDQIASISGTLRRSLSASALSPLGATLMGPRVSVANKRLTAKLNPLNATLTKNRGEGAHTLTPKNFHELLLPRTPRPLGGEILPLAADTSRPAQTAP